VRLVKTVLVGPSLLAESEVQVLCLSRFVLWVLENGHRLILDISHLARCRRVVAGDNIDQEEYNQEYAEAMLTSTKFTTTLRAGVENGRSSLTVSLGQYERPITLFA